MSFTGRVRRLPIASNGRVKGYISRTHRYVLSYFLDSRLKDIKQLTRDIKNIGISSGFRHVGIASPEVSLWGSRFQEWLKNGYEGEMAFLARNTERRSILLIFSRRSNLS